MHYDRVLVIMWIKKLLFISLWTLVKHKHNQLIAMFINTDDKIWNLLWNYHI